MSEANQRKIGIVLDLLNLYDNMYSFHSQLHRYWTHYLKE